MINGNKIEWRNTYEYYEVSSLPPNDNGYRVLVLTEGGKLFIATGEYEGYIKHLYIKVNGYNNDILKDEVIAWEPIWLPKDFVWNEIVRSLELTGEREIDMYKRKFERLISTRNDKELI